MVSVTEEWRPVAVRPGYEVSNLGRVRSVEREIWRKSRWGQDVRYVMQGRVLRQHEQNAGYMMAALGVRFSRLTHALVAEAFLGPRPDRHDVNHIDGNKHNNVATNLEYVTRKENMEHAKRTGIWDNRGEANGQAKTTASQIKEAFRLMLSGMRMKDAAKQVGTTATVLGKVKRGEKWKHLNLSAKSA